MTTPTPPASSGTANEGQPIPGYLFIAMDDDDCAHPEFCADRAAVVDAVTRSMFWTPEGEELSADHKEQAEATADELIEEGFIRFEGDPGFTLYKLHNGADLIAQAERQAFFLKQERDRALAALSATAPAPEAAVGSGALPTFASDVYPGYLRKQASRLLAQLDNRRPRRALDLVDTQRLLEKVAAPADTDKLIAELIKASWQWGKSCEIDDVSWGEAGDSHNQMWRDQVQEVATRLQASLVATPQQPSRDAVSGERAASTSEPPAASGAQPIDPELLVGNLVAATLAEEREEGNDRELAAAADRFIRAKNALLCALRQGGAQ